jgi:ACR3 family arsenite transporter
MYPVLAKVRYTDARRITSDRRLLGASLALNWLVGPALMFSLAWLLLPDLPAYRTGLIIVGLARCIAMVLIWNGLSCGDAEAAAVLVALNSIFQIVAFAGLGYFYLDLLPGWLGLSTSTAHVGMARIAFSVLAFLGTPLLLGFLTRTLGERSKGRDWYEQSFLPKIGPVALYGLLFTIVVLFALQGHTITARPGEVARIALPLLAYFAIMFLRRGSRGRRRTTDRGTCTRRIGLRVAVGARAVLQRSGDRGPWPGTATVMTAARRRISKERHGTPVTV